MVHMEAKGRKSVREGGRSVEVMDREVVSRFEAATTDLERLMLRGATNT